MINHQRRPTKLPAPLGYEWDHIIPYCLSGDNSKENLQLLKYMDHKRKTYKDRRIINILKKEGYVKTITFYLMEWHKPLEEIKKRYLELWEEINND